MASLDRPVLIVGGAGFIGTNLAAHLAGNGCRVRIYDDLSRDGVAENLAWLRETYGDLVEARIADVRSPADLRAALDSAQAVFHFAAQVAVTTSLGEPRHDFDVNARGTVELLEALRALPVPPPLVYTSTNKVYGELADVALELRDDRWHPTNPAVAARGIGEQRPLAFHTPYGCSKGCADQYVLEYARAFGLPATVFRMSCVYGPHQHGNEDQGWIAHFLIAALESRPITIYGDGRQVRDVLFIDDLVDAFIRAWRHIDRIRGRAFNLGGGPANTLSLLEGIALISRLTPPPDVKFADWRSGDQRYYVSDTAAFTDATDWRPRVTPHAGVEALHGWLASSAEGGIRV